MKIIGRIFIILIAAFVVIGAVAAFARTGMAAQLMPGGRGGEFTDGRFPEDGLPEGFNPREFRDGDVDGGFPDGFDAGEFRRGERHGERPGSGVFSFMGLGRNLLTIVVIVLLVTMISRLFPRRKLRLKAAE